MAWVSGAQVHRADAEANVAIVDPVEIDEPLERRPQRRGVIEADLVRSLRRPEFRRRETRRKEGRRAKHGDEEGAGLIYEPMRLWVLERDRRVVWAASGPSGGLLTASENSRKRATRASGGLPAMRAIVADRNSGDRVGRTFASASACRPPPDRPRARLRPAAAARSCRTAAIRAPVAAWYVCRRTRH